MFPRMQVPLHGDGEVPNLLIVIRDIGSFVARIIGDERTLNKHFYCWGDLLTENKIYDVMEEVSGEKLERVLKKKYVSESADDVFNSIDRRYRCQTRKWEHMCNR